MMCSIERNRGGEEHAADVKKATEEGIPLGRYAQPEEIDDLITYLASDKSSFITGSYIKIDGGTAAMSS